MIALVAFLAAVIVGIPTAIALQYAPTDVYRVHRVRVVCVDGVDADACPARDEWLAFASAEIARFEGAGVASERDAWRSLRGVEWRYSPDPIDTPWITSGWSYALSNPGTSSRVWVEYALTPGTDGHEIRLQVCHGLQRDDWPESQCMRWLDEAGIYEYSDGAIDALIDAGGL